MSDEQRIERWIDAANILQTEIDAKDTRIAELELFVDSYEQAHKSHARKIEQLNAVIAELEATVREGE